MGKEAEERLNWGNDESERTQAASTAPRRPSHSDQPHHRLLPGIGRAVGGPESPPSPAGEYPSLGRRPAPDPGPDLRQRYLLRAAHRLPWKALDATGICSGSTAHLRFQQWAAAGVFLELRTGLERYDELKGLDWSWLSIRGHPPWAGGKTGPNPTDRGKSGQTQSVDRSPRSVGLAVDGANRHDMKLVRATVDSLPVPQGLPGQGLRL